jgi:beta-aspartyl-dipeptidase (metallo-type)
MTLLVKDCGMALDDALKLITANPARNLKLKSKGRIAVGMDADLCFLDDKLTLRHVMAMGDMAMVSQKILIKGRYE